MLRRIRRLPSPALVISAIALIVAVGGGSVALAVSDNHKDKKIAKKVANKQITKRAPGLSVNHANSADTATNSAQLGGLGPSGFVENQNIVVRTNTIDVPSGFAFGATAQCASGEHATGGGISDPGTNATSRVTTSYPVNASGGAVTAGQQPTGWHAQAFQSSGSTITYTVYAVCVH